MPRRFRTLSSLFCCLILAAGCESVSSQPHDASLHVSADRQPWQIPNGNGEVVLTEHYRIFTNLPASALASSLPGVMEGAYRQYARLTGQSASTDGRRFDMYMMASRQDWASLTRLRMGRHAGAALNLQAGGYTVNGVTVCWNIGGMASVTVACHEGMHQFLYHRMQQPLPLWAEEGLATTMEGIGIHGNRVRFTPDFNAMRLSDLRTTFTRREWIPLGRLLQSNPKQIVASGRGSALGYYAQVYALMHWLRNTPRHAAGLQRMLDDAAGGQFGRIVPARHLQRRGDRYTAAVALPLFRHYIGHSIEALDTEFRAYAEDLAGL
jgi:hypothetical protein